MISIKASASKNESFAPVKLVITLESQQELNRMAALFNHSGMLRFLMGEFDQSVFRMLSECGADYAAPGAWDVLKTIRL